MSDTPARIVGSSGMDGYDTVTAALGSGVDEFVPPRSILIMVPGSTAWKNVWGAATGVGSHLAVSFR